MSQVNVITPRGTSNSVVQYSIECPFCHSNVIPDYLCWDKQALFACCPNEECKEHFVLLMDPFGKYKMIKPNAIPRNKIFSKIITDISPLFASIYNQAYHAEQMNLSQICGVGYRKALEFLIKDYLISRETDEQIIDNIKNKFLSNCIQENVKNDNIKNVAKRAVWLGNDETHYVRQWADKDVCNLKQLIDLTVWWIESEIGTERVLQEMQ
ncbi:MAG: DUF4145 domain-containing protein [Bacteroidaceae bacterium]|nr:DUF4145 domain-containing protein [Bacteroidaceae bacterium]